MSKITYENKVALSEKPEVDDINKVKATDMNEIKEVVNQNDDNVGNLSNLETIDKSSLVNAVNEIITQNAYSLEETLTGKYWIDGKPTYRKVINVGAITGSGTITIAHNISNFKRCINIYGYAYRETYDNSLPLPYAEVGNSIALKTDKINLTITPTWNPLVTESYVILEYTKTID